MTAESKQTQNIIVTPPQPNGKLPIVGHLAAINKISKQLGKTDMAPLMNEAFKQCVGDNSINGDTVFLHLPGMPIYLTSNVDYAATVMKDLQNWGKITHKDTRGGYYASRTIVGDSLFTASDGEGHSKSHRILMPAFSPRSLSSLVDITLLKTDILLDRIESSNKKPFEIGNAFTGLTFDIIGNFIGGTGLDFKTTENPEIMSTEPFLQSLNVALTTKYIHDNIDDGKFTDRKVYKRRDDARNALWNHATNVINDRINGKTMSTGGKTAPDVLDRMLNTIDKGKFQYFCNSSIMFDHDFDPI
jgi:cytochrome P450/NADPH-cytochrome P450 reductase